ncbi:MAG: HDOD domain-containing protein [Candidatus Micrarchaeia archaeon]
MPNKKIEIDIAKINIPVIPDILLRVTKLIKEDKASIYLLQKLITSDQAFTAKLLHVANSPYYGQTRKVESIRQALLLVGFENFKNIIISTAIDNLYKKTDKFEFSLWKHSVNVAYFASLLAVITEKTTSECAYMLGLLHDIGKLILYRNFPKEYLSLYKNLDFDKKNIHAIELEKEKLGISHIEAGIMLAEKWYFPDKITTVIKHSHNNEIPFNVNYRNECLLIKLANLLFYVTVKKNNSEVIMSDILKILKELDITEELFEEIVKKSNIQKSFISPAGETPSVREE